MSAAQYYQLNQYHPAPPAAVAEQPNSAPFDPYNAYLHVSSHNGIPPRSSEPLLAPGDGKIPGVQITSPGGTDRLGERKVQKSLRRQRITKLASKTASVFFAGIMFAIMVELIIVRQRTLTVVRGGRNPWPKETKIWPTYMLLAASGSTVVLALVSLVFYCCAYDRAHRSWKLTLVRNVMHVLIWITVSALYRYEKSLGGKPDDLWGWSCSPEAQKIQAEFQDVVHFRSLCTAQVCLYSKLIFIPCLLIIGYSQVRGAFPLPNSSLRWHSLFTSSSYTKTPETWRTSDSPIVLVAPYLE